MDRETLYPLHDYTIASTNAYWFPHGRKLTDRAVRILSRGTHNFKVNNWAQPVAVLNYSMAYTSYLHSSRLLDSFYFHINRWINNFSGEWWNWLRVRLVLCLEAVSIKPPIVPTRPGLSTNLLSIGYVWQFLSYWATLLTLITRQTDKTNLSHDGLNPAHDPFL